MMELKKTPLWSEHKRLGAKMVEFGGWEMPLQYTSIIEEHKTVRESAGIFDVSHMGEILVEGPDTLRFVDKLITNSVSKLKNGEICYSPMCYENATIVDDLLAYRFSENKILLVVNASNTDKDYEWIISQKHGYNVDVKNLSKDYAQIAFQGPKAEQILKKISGVDLSRISFYTFTLGQINGINCIVSRTGYTGEDGFEMYFQPDAAVALWRKLIEIGGKEVKPCGLGSRDTLRFEATYMLYGNDIDDTTTPLEAGLGWTVDFTKPTFNGKEVLLRQKENGVSKRLRGFEIDGGIARHGYEIFDGEKKIGHITSGTKSPTLNKSLALGYVETQYSKIGSEVLVDVHGKKVRATVVKTPFYRGSVKSK
ncbi:MAG: glycine cleavage system aminomethyltransferase GcvT [Athalassotoga sp.]|uniref:glycine cleavage system aminomethyltransferase GcvT n=1 Tax=Athalassotoga sp. TaxID=2022597 RepID=UPI003D0554FC